MNTQHILKIVSAASVFLGIALPLAFVQADTATSSQQAPVANVYIHDAAIVSNTQNSFTVLFYIGNGSGAQPDVKYGVQLFQAGPNSSQVLADQYVASDTLSLTSGEAMKIHQLTYTAPAFFSGTYQVWVTAENSNGFPYSAVPVGSVTFTPSVQGSVTVLNPTCLLSVEGDASNTQYTPSQGVDILPSESLIATCQIQNNFSAQEVVWPQFQTQYRSQYGAVVSLPTPPPATTTLAAHKTQTIAFALPIAADPQAYDVSMNFVDASGAVVSNSIVFHYVVDGPSGTIQNAVLDKNSYVLGDTAQATVVWTPSADSFAGSRNGTAATGTLQLVVALSSAGSNMPCSASVTKTVPASGPSAVIAIPLISFCSNPSLQVTLKDMQGNVLDQKTFTATSPQSSHSPHNLLVVTVTLLAAALLYAIIDFIIHKRSKHPIV